MNCTDFLYGMLDNYPIVTAAVLCFLPMRNQFKKELYAAIIDTFIYLVVLITLDSYLLLSHPIPYDADIPIICIVSFIVYDRIFKTSLDKKLFTFTSVCATVGFLSNFSHGFDAVMNPTSDILHISHEASMFQFLICTLFTLLFCYPIMRYGSQLIDTFESKNTWYFASTISVIFFLLNLVIAPRHYTTLHTNNIMPAFWLIMTLCFFLMMFLFTIFYHIVMSAMESSRLSARLRYLEMLESQHRKLQSYMENTRRQRHDFRHTLRTLYTLSTDADNETIRTYLNQYLDNMPESDLTLFTKNIAVNAVLNYYMESARTASIKLTWEVDLDETTPWIADSDLCIILGNILDNAVIACTEANPPIPKSERFIDFYIKSENNKTIYIIAANSFDGRIITSDEGKIISSHEHGSGIGLSSIKTTAENYNGTANFYHENKEFYSEVMLRSPD